MVENSSHLHGCEQLTRFGDDFLLIVGWFFVVVVFFIFVLFACCVDEACICICLKKIDFVTVSFGIYLRKKNWNASFGIALITFDVRRTCLDFVIGVLCFLSCSLSNRKKPKQFDAYCVHARVDRQKICQ